MNEINPSWNHTIRTGSVCGVTVWGAYALAESWTAVILPWIMEAPSEYKPLNRSVTLAVFILYPLVGMVLGALAAVSVRLRTGRRFEPETDSGKQLLQMLSLLPLVMLFTGNYFLRAPNPSRVIQCLLIVLTLVVCTGLVGRNRTQRTLVTPWLIPVLMVGIPWLRIDVFSEQGAMLNSLLIAGAAAALLGLVYWTLRRGVKTELRTSLAASVLVVVTVGLAFAARSRPSVIPGNAGIPAGGKDLPNVILITLDTVRADHLSLYGYKRQTSPELEKIAEESAVYTVAISPADMTLPAHASILTGLYPSLHGARFGPDTLYGNKLSENFYTLAEALSDRGYRTAAVIANHGYLNTTFGFSQGFEYYDDRSSGRISAGHKHYLRTLIGDAVCNTISLLECEVYYRNAAEITKEATRLLQQLKQEGATPFFLFLNFMDAHAPYNPPAPFDTLFPGKSAAFTREHNAMLIRDVNSLRRSITDAERDHLISQYDGGIAFIDQQLGILVARLRELDIYKNTILVITSDHGEAFGDRNLMEHGVSVYQDQVHVPLIIKYPGSLVKGRFEDVVSTADILPTVLTLLGLSVPKNLQGLPLNGIATNYDDERPVLSETNATAELRRWHKRFDRVQHALVRGRWKFIKSGAKQELYDIHTDPHESRNLCSNLGESCSKFDDELESWLARVSTPAVAPPKLNNADMERLKSLGYVQ